MNWNILVAGGKESKRDSRSSGERSGNSLNLNFVFKGRGRTKIKTSLLDEAAESCTIDGESPVVESKSNKFIPSSMGHVKSRVNQRGPPRKAKYSWVTDSEIVPRGKGEKEPL